MLLAPELRARLKGLRLATRLTPTGQGIGQHASNSRGAGLEFAQYRAYEPGDEPRSIDWKLYARSDRYYVRDATRDSPLNACVLIDASASMAQADRARPAYGKLDAARTIAACIGDIALQQGDRFSFTAIGGDGVTGVPAGNTLRHRDRFELGLQALRAQGRVPARDGLRVLWERIPAASLVVLLSDGFDDDVVEVAERLARTQRDVISIQLITADERDFPFDGGHLFEDVEAGVERLVDASGVRSDFLARFGAARQALARRYAASGIRHVEHFLDQSPAQVLRTLFGPRRP